MTQPIDWFVSKEKSTSSSSSKSSSNNNDYEPLFFDFTTTIMQKSLSSSWGNYFWCTNAQQQQQSSDPNIITTTSSIVVVPQDTDDQISYTSESSYSCSIIDDENDDNDDSLTMDVSPLLSDHNYYQHHNHNKVITSDNDDHDDKLRQCSVDTNAAVYLEENNFNSYYYNNNNTNDNISTRTTTKFTSSSCRYNIDESIASTWIQQQGNTTTNIIGSDNSNINTEQHQQLHHSNTVVTKITKSTKKEENIISYDWEQVDGRVDNDEDIPFDEIFPLSDSPARTTTHDLTSSTKRKGTIKKLTKTNPDSMMTDDKVVHKFVKTTNNNKSEKTSLQQQQQASSISCNNDVRVPVSYTSKEGKKKNKNTIIEDHNASNNTVEMRNSISKVLKLNKKDNDDNNNNNNNKEAKNMWKTAVDASSGRTYWYHIKTRETQWDKPLCCATARERKEIEKKQQQTRDFFTAMEANILKSLNTTTTTTTKGTNVVAVSNNKKQEQSNNNDSSNSIKRVTKQQQNDNNNNNSIQKPTRIVRTISNMEDSVLAHLVQRVPSSHRQHVGNDDNNNNSNEFLLSSYNNNTETEQQQQLSPDTPQLERENSLNLTAALERQSSQTNNNNNNSSFNNGSFRNSFSQMHSNNNTGFGGGGGFTSLRGGSTMRLVPEGENEDTSNSQHEDPFLLQENEVFVSSDFQQQQQQQNDATTHNKPVKRGIVRFEGTLKLGNTFFGGETSTEASIPRPDGVSRENSLNLEALVRGGSGDGVEGTDKNNNSDGAYDDFSFNAPFRMNSGGNWGDDSFMNSQDLAQDEEDTALLNLAAISNEMANVSPSLSSNTSLDGIQVFESFGNRVPNKRDSPAEYSMEFSDDDDTNDYGESYMIVEKNNAQNSGKQKSQTMEEEAARPTLPRPVSLRVQPSMSIEKPGMLRRNTCGTLYVGSTMSAPDIEATIKCVCGVYRAHILQSESDEDDVEDVEHRVFIDLDSHREAKKGKHVVAWQKQQQKRQDVPSLDEISLFYRDVFTRAKMETDCIIISLIYVERLIKVTSGALRPRATNWRSMLFSCMVLASKVWDDCSMWNADFSLTCPAGVQFSLKRVNELEVAVLSALSYKVKVPASEYAKYYFLLRSMLIKSGLGSDNLKTMNPLDVEGARQLQHMSSQYQSSATNKNQLQKLSLARARTAGARMVQTIESPKRRITNTTNDTNNNITQIYSSSPVETRSRVSLEHVVQM